MNSWTAAPGEMSYDTGYTPARRPNGICPGCDRETYIADRQTTQDLCDWCCSLRDIRLRESNEAIYNRSMLQDFRASVGR